MELTQFTVLLLKHTSFTRLVQPTTAESSIMNTPSNPPVHVRDLHLVVPDGSSTRSVVDGVSFTVAPGEVLGITGPSGSGKSTILSILAGLQTPTSGDVLIDGTNVSLLNHRQRATLRRERLGIVFQQANLLPALTAREQLLTMRRLSGIQGLTRKAWRKAKADADALLDQVGLAAFADVPAVQLSGGQQARINLARALMNNPEVLLVDEPTAALDTTNADAVTALLLDLAQQRQTSVIYVSHDQHQLAQLDRVITLVDGRIVPETSFAVQ